MNRTRLEGLEGTNPLGFLAALGVQTVFASAARGPRLSWTDEVTPRAVVGSDYSPERIAERAVPVFRVWARSSAVNPTDPDGQPLEKGTELKLKPEAVRHYLSPAAVRTEGAANPATGDALRSALVAEGSLAANGVSKPTDLYFAAGNMKFLAIARKIFEGVTQQDVIDGLRSPWPYRSKLPSLMWDVADDRVYALRGYDPASAGEKKRTNPGPEALALLGLSMHPVFALQNGRSSRTLTQGCSGRWTKGFYSWPLWRKPALPRCVRSILAHAYDHPDDRDPRQDWYRSWGVVSILKAPIRRSSQGGYGTFGPPSVTWRDPAYS